MVRKASPFGYNMVAVLSIFGRQLSSGTQSYGVTSIRISEIHGFEGGESGKERSGLWYHSCWKDPARIRIGLSVRHLQLQRNGWQAQDSGMRRMTKIGLPDVRLVGSIVLGTLLILQFGAAPRGSAQTAASAAQSGLSTPSAGIATNEAKAPPPAATLANPRTETSSPNLVARTGPPEDEMNRKELEDNAGRDPASLMMRSAPTGAMIYINGAFVGHTPLLLNVAPAKYKIEMRGQRDDFAARTVGLLANDRQEILLTLQTRYPNRISMH
jgi:hypothetical protein